MRWLIPTIRPSVQGFKQENLALQAALHAGFVDSYLPMKPQKMRIFFRNPQRTPAPAEFGEQSLISTIQRKEELLNTIMENYSHDSLLKVMWG